jgi:hypothetical protein
MIPPSIFPSKTDGFLRQQHVAPLKLWHVTPYIYIFSIFFKKNKNCTGGSATPKTGLGGGSDTPTILIFFFKKKTENKIYIYIYMGATYRWHGNQILLNGKIDGGTSIFSHSTSTTYEKMKTEREKKIKFLNHMGQKSI